MIITAPDNLDTSRSNPSLFLAGGITNCPDWQQEAIDMLVPKAPNLDIINPRRTKWNMDSDANESIKQIQWEYRHILHSKLILFWFPKETLCPITLLELGAAMYSKPNLHVGVHPEYKRKLDVIEQLRLARPDVVVYESLEDLIDSIVPREE